MTGEDDGRIWFSVFNEIGIINQLATTAFNRALPRGLHVSHFSVINHLLRLGDGRTPQQIASAFQVTKPTMTHTLTKLSALRFVEIRPNPQDGRSKCVFLTDEGRTFHSEAIAALAPRLKGIAAELDTRQAAKLLPELRAIRAYLDNNRNVTANDVKQDSKR